MSPFAPRKNALSRSERRLDDGLPQGKSFRWPALVRDSHRGNGLHVDRPGAEKARDHRPLLGRKRHPHALSWLVSAVAPVEPDLTPAGGEGDQHDPERLGDIRAL